METRYFPAELRVDKEGRIEGYAAVFDQLSEVLGWFRERIRKGNFTKTLREADIRALFNHDPNYVLGRNRAGTLDLAEDDHGLYFRAAPPETQWANDLYQSVERGDINQGSFKFQAIRDEWDYDADPIERELIESRLYDVSVVTYPAYPQTSVSARALAQQFINQVREHTDPDTIAFMRDQLSQLDAISQRPTAPVQEDHPAEREVDAEDIETVETVAPAHQLELLRRRLDLKTRR